MRHKELMRTVFDWTHFYSYLCGPIDFDRLGGFSWREEWTKKLVSIGFKRRQILNPRKKPLKGAPFNFDNEGAIMQSHRKKNDYKGLCNVMSQIVHVDLRFVDKSDIVFVNMPKFSLPDSFLRKDESLRKKLVIEKFNFETQDIVLKLIKNYAEVIQMLKSQRIPTYGSMHEIVVARQQRKPVFVVWEDGKKTCSAWLMWLVGHENVFGSVDEMIIRLKQISQGKQSFNAKDWLLLDL